MAWSGSATTIATEMRSPNPSYWRRWFLPVVFLTVAPKCILCLAAYAGIGTAVSREICGASAEDGMLWIEIAGATAGILGLAAVLRRSLAAVKRSTPSP